MAILSKDKERPAEKKGRGHRRSSIAGCKEGGCQLREEVQKVTVLRKCEPSLGVGLLLLPLNSVC